jgi:hypothetical protein
LSKFAIACTLTGFFIFILGVVLWKRWRAPRPYVIGEHMARAQTTERARRSSAASPLPSNLKYVDADLSDPTPHPLDEELSALCRRFGEADAAGRSRLRDSASLSDFYTLLAFSRRSAVFGMRRRHPNLVTDALAAVAMIDPDRIDFRDALVALSLLHHAARAIGANPDGLFAHAATLADSKMSTLILGFLSRSEEDRNLQKSWGYTVIETEGGPGFVQSGFESYQPSLRLDRAGMALGRLLAQDKYSSGSITLASALPPVWLSSVDDKALNTALAGVRGVVTINAHLPPESADCAGQVLMIFLAEMDSEIAADSLFTLALEKQRKGSDFASLPVREGRLFCLTVGRSIMANSATLETNATLRRFAPAISSALKDLLH